MHLIVHSQYFRPEIGAPQRRLGALVDDLVAAGHRVTVLTAFPNYPTGRIPRGYRGPWRIEEDGALRIVRVPLFATPSVRFVPRMLNYLSFALVSLVIGGWKVGRADYLLTESPPLFLGPAGWLLARWKRARWIFNVSDLWPDSAVRLGKVRPGSLAHRWTTALEEWCYRRAWLVSGQSRGIVADIESRDGVDGVRLLSNGVVLEDFPLVEPRAPGDTLRIVYAGLHGIAQGLEEFVSALEGEDGRRGIRIGFWGGGPCKAGVVAAARRRGLDFVEFHDPVTAEQVPPILSGADVILVPLALVLPGAVPSKLYEAMASGRPVLLIGEGEPAKIVERYGCGVVVPPGDSARLRSALDFLLAHPAERLGMGRAGREAAESAFDRRRINGEFISFLDNALTGR